MRTIVGVIIFCLFCTVVKGQDDSTTINKEIDFLLFLEQQGQTDDVVFYVDSLLNSEQNYNESQMDSIHFLLGEINYKKSNYNDSFKYFKKVSNKSLFYYKSLFNACVSLTEEKQYPLAYQHLDASKIDSNNTLLIGLQNITLSGLALINKDYMLFDSLSNTFQSYDETLIREHALQVKYSQSLKNIKRKSPWVAGGLSAIVPGLGLVYSGNNGQGLAALIRVASLAGISIESYNKLGPNHPQFLIFAGLFSLFYIGNIWGSALSVQIRYDEKIKEIEHNLSVGIKIPVDYFFK